MLHLSTKTRTLVKCCADPKLSFIKSLTGQHFFSFFYFRFVIALLPNTKWPSPHSMSSLDLPNKHSPGKLICESFLKKCPDHDISK